MKKVVVVLLCVCSVAHFSLAQDGHMHSKETAESSAILKSMHENMGEFMESGNVDIDFLTNMIPHHLGAINSAKELLRLKTLNPRIQTIAQNIIKAQEQEIKEFQKLLENKASFNQTQVTQEQYRDFTKQAKADMEAMMQGMHHASSNDPQKDFMQGMIAHHLGAIKASQQILTLTKDKRIQTIAQNIIKAQEQEIEDFKQLLQE